MKDRRGRPAAFAAVLLSFLLLAAGCAKGGETAMQEASAMQEDSAVQDYAAVRGTDVEVPGEGCVFVELPGSFETPDPDRILERLNEIRLEACREGVMNPVTGDPLTEADYVPLTWSADLEKTARLRAAEACVVQDHVRPNGGDCFSVAYGGQKANYETLAWGYADIPASVEGWYSEKEAYTEETGGVASHYVALITPGNRWVGAAAFTPADGALAGLDGGSADPAGKGTGLTGGFSGGTRLACAAEFAMEPGGQAGAEAEEPAAGEAAEPVETEPAGAADAAEPAPAPTAEDPYGPCRQIIEVQKAFLSDAEAAQSVTEPEAR